MEKFEQHIETVLPLVCIFKCSCMIICIICACDEVNSWKVKIGQTGGS